MQAKIKVLVLISFVCQLLPIISLLMTLSQMIKYKKILNKQ